MKSADWSALPPTTPPNVSFVLRRSLEKDPRRRLSSAADLQIQLEEPQAAPATETTVAAKPSPPPMPPLLQRAIPWAAAFALGLVVASLGVWSLTRSNPPAPQPVARFAVTLPPDQQFITNLRRSRVSMVVLSPDGTHLVYVANGQRYLRPIAELEVTPIRGTEGSAGEPFFSPNGQWVGFETRGGLKKVPIAGGAPVTLAVIGPLSGASWGTDDIITFGQPDGIWQVSSSGGAKQLLVEGDSLAGEQVYRPEILPGGKSVLYTARVSRDWNDSRIVVQELETGEQRVLVEGGSDGRYVPTGHLAYFRDRTLFAVPLDLVRMEVTGGPVPIVERVMGVSRIDFTIDAVGAAQFSFSRNGSLIYVVGEELVQTEYTLVWVDRQGREEPLGVPPHDYGQLQLSPDGRQLAARTGDSLATQDIWVYDLERGALSRLTFEGRRSRPLWTPDGKHIVYRSVTDGGGDVSWKSADGTSQEEQITRVGVVATVSSISPDGKLAFYYTGPAAGRDLWMVPLEGDRKPTPFLQGPFNETSPKISPDGRWVAYISNESGWNEIFVRPFPASSGKWQVSTDGAEAPVWARSGRELFYQDGGKMMVVDIDRSRDSFQAGTPRMLFEGNYVQGNNEAFYDVSRDGRRFLMVKPGGQSASAPPPQINVVLNWFEELKQRVPAP